MKMKRLFICFIPIIGAIWMLLDAYDSVQGMINNEVAITFWNVFFAALFIIFGIGSIFYILRYIVGERKEKSKEKVKDETIRPWVEP